MILRGGLIAALAVACGQVTASKDASQDVAAPDVETRPDTSPPPSMSLGWESQDFGDEPDFEGCVEEYLSSDTMCSGSIVASYGDTCLDSTTIVEILDMDCEPMPLRTKSYDCRTVLKDPKATCVEVPDSCFPGNPKTGTKSAFCDAPFTFDAGTDGAVIIDASGD